jgi:hypothetical protein
VDAATGPCILSQTTVPAKIPIISKTAATTILMVFGCALAKAARTSIKSWGLFSVSAFPHLGQTKAVPPGIEIACNQSAIWQFLKLVHLPRRVLN